jgi:hypothetical protein
VRFSILAINLLVLGFIALAVGQTVASWSADLVEGRRRLRVFIVSAAALYGGIFRNRRAVSIFHRCDF